MSEELLVRHCAPTLAGIKTASVFSCSYESKECLLHGIRRLNRLLRGKGLRIVPLRVKEGRALIYVYRPKQLQGALLDEEAKKILESFGYSCEASDRCLLRLIRRLQESEGFPHEIGLFLGYPAEDVAGFIEKGAKNYKYSGLWKVYGDEANAKRLFERYRRCTDLYLSDFAQGKPIETLAVSR